jgi:hypothetical protein
MNRCRLRIPVLTDRSLQTTPVSHDSQNPTNGLTMTAYRRKLWLRPPNGCRLRSGTASFMKLLLSVGVILWAVHASAQEVRPGREKLPDALPPTSVVAASPSPSSMSPASRPATDPKPSIMWHWVDGRWHWHCVAHCSEFRRYHGSLGSEDATQSYTSDAN